MLKFSLTSLATVCLSCSSIVASPVTNLTTTEYASNSEGYCIDTPHIELFTRSQSIATNLPGYAVDLASYQKQLAADIDSLASDVKSDELSLFSPALTI